MEQAQLIADTGGQITDLAPIDTDANRVAIRIEHKRFAILSAEEVGNLKLKVGQAWTMQLEALVYEAIDRDKARAAAMRLITKTPKSQSEILTRLRERGFSQAASESVVADLERAGLIDDENLARQIVDHETRRGAGARLLEAKLAKRGIDAHVAQQAVSEGLAQTDPVQEATEIARQRAATFQTNLSPETAANRLFGLLSRRGFSQEASQEAVRTVIRQLPPPD